MAFFKGRLTRLADPDGAPPASLQFPASTWRDWAGQWCEDRNRVAAMFNRRDRWTVKERQERSGPVAAICKVDLLEMGQ